MIQIYGAGMAGCYLAKLCENEGIKYKIYDIRNKPDCRCAWGISEWNYFSKLLKDIGYNVNDYLLNKCRKVITNIVDFKCKVYTIDKSKLLSDFWNELSVNKPEEQTEDIIVDATGYRRSILPLIRNDVIVPCHQIRCKTNLDSRNIYIFISKDLKGYAWAFPIGDEWHIGAGHIDGIKLSKELILKLIKFFKVGIKNVSCNCSSYVRHIPPSRCKPIYFYNGRNIFGIGESIGAVTFVGAGNVTSLISSKVLIKTLLSEDDYYKYEEEIIKTFSYIEDSYKLFEYMIRKDIANVIKLSKEFISSIRIGSISPIDVIKLTRIAFKFMVGKEVIKDVEVKKR